MKGISQREFSEHYFEIIYCGAKAVAKIKVSKCDLMPSLEARRVAGGAQRSSEYVLLDFSFFFLLVLFLLV